MTFNNNKKIINYLHFFQIENAWIVDEASEFTLFPAEQIHSQSKLRKRWSFLRERA